MSDSTGQPGGSHGTKARLRQSVALRVGPIRSDLLGVFELALLLAQFAAPGDTLDGDTIEVLSPEKKPVRTRNGGTT